MSESWNVWSKWVIESIRKCQLDLAGITLLHNEDILKLLKEIHELRTEIAVQKVKVGIWGCIGAAIPAGGGLIILFLKGVLK